jgi:hypothetical protein
MLSRWLGGEASAAGVRRGRPLGARVASHAIAILPFSWEDPALPVTASLSQQGDEILQDGQRAGSRPYGDSIDIPFDRLYRR